MPSLLPQSPDGETEAIHRSTYIERDRRAGITDTMSEEANVPKTKIAVYCGSSPGHDPRHLAMARNLATAMAKRNIGLGTVRPGSSSVPATSY